VTESVEQIDDELWAISLTRPQAWPESLQDPNRVYIIGGDNPAMINAGHPSQHEEVVAGIEAIDDPRVEPERILRVVHTSWSIDVLGGAVNFPDADHFVSSPDMIRPSRYEALIEERRQAYRQLAEAAADQQPNADMEAVEAFVESYWPKMPESLPIIPIRNGQTVRAGAAELEIMGAEGPGPGNVALLERGRDWLFCGDMTTSGLPYQMRDLRSYMVALERLLDLEIGWLLPNRDRPRKRGDWAIRSAITFINNFMSNAPSAMFEEPTLLEFVERDLGYRPDDFVDLVWKASLYRELMDELVRSKMIESEGSGIERVYGVNIDDPRGEIRDYGRTQPEP
jgi:glyoxylase-like metal-dependent hydrolase (beta-lactamase superfamily II)